MNNTLIGKKILIGITGGIAAYKINELIRLLRDAGAQAQIVITPHAKEFVTPLTLETLSGKPVYSDLFDKNFESNIGHIQLSRWADIIMIAPASANFIARLSHGFADDLLATLCLATRAPIVIAPAMNKNMWEHQITQENITQLKKNGIHFIEPDEGPQACGDYGLGRLKEPMALLTWLKHFFSTTTHPTLSGKKVIVTAGPTHEFIDPVRYLSTPSSGSMGYATADVLAKLGAEVLLISGPSPLSTPPNMKRIDVISADDMQTAVTNHLPCDIFIGTAAVADYRPASYTTSKIKRHADSLSLNLVKNPDILRSVKTACPNAFIVGFAAETDNHLKNAKEKLEKKGVHIIVLNAVEDGKGFGMNQKNNTTILMQNGKQLNLPTLHKSEIAIHLATLIGDTLST